MLHIFWIILMEKVFLSMAFCLLFFFYWEIACGVEESPHFEECLVWYCSLQCSVFEAYGMAFERLER